MVTVYIDFGKN